MSVLLLHAGTQCAAPDWGCLQQCLCFTATHQVPQMRLRSLQMLSLDIFIHFTDDKCSLKISHPSRYTSQTLWFFFHRGSSSHSCASISRYIWLSQTIKWKLSRSALSAPIFKHPTCSVLLIMSSSLILPTLVPANQQLNLHISLNILPLKTQNLCWVRVLFAFCVHNKNC